MILILVPILVAGIFLRIYHLPDQLILDDEWHTLYYVIGKSLPELLFKPAYAANSMPINFYAGWLLQSLGWSEFSLRLISQFFGIVSLVVFPCVLNKVLKKTSLLFFAALMSLSPFLIFYSRVLRPYMAVAFFGFLTVVLAYLWVTQKKRGFGALVALTSLLTLYTHLSAAPTLLVCWGFVLVMKRFGQTRISWVELIGSIGGIGVGAFLLYGNAFANSEWISTIVGRDDELHFSSLYSMLELISGNGLPWWILLFWMLVLFGSWQLYQNQRVLACFFFALILSNFGILFFSNFNYGSSAIVLTRYMIAIVPIFYVLAACGLDLLRGKWKLMSIPLFAFFFLQGPLPQTYSMPNQFTNHSAFQEHYGPMEWSRSYQSDMSVSQGISQSDVSLFYKKLAEERDVSIIEYPMLMGDHFNLYYYYQHFHKKEIFAGYTRRQPPLQAEKEHVLGYYVLDQIFWKFSDKEPLRWKRYVDVADPKEVRDSGARYIVVHRQLLREMYPTGSPVYHVPIFRLSQQLRKTYGEPVYRDEKIYVFKVGKQLSVEKDG